MSVTSRKLEKVGFNEENFNDFVEKNRQQFLKAGQTPEEAESNARAFGDIYRDQFRTYK